VHYDKRTKTKEQYYSAKQIIVRGKPIIVRTKTIIVRAKPIIVRAKPIIVHSDSMLFVFILSLQLYQNILFVIVPEDYLDF
jgi:hypothetical protein